jgi:hypothetical protein
VSVQVGITSCHKLSQCRTDLIRHPAFLETDAVANVREQRALKLVFDVYDELKYTRSWLVAYTAASGLTDLSNFTSQVSSYHSEKWRIFCHRVNYIFSLNVLNHDITWPGSKLMYA